MCLYLNYISNESDCSLSFTNIVRVIKSVRLRWAGHVARMEEVRSGLKILIGKPTGNMDSNIRGRNVG